VLTPSVEVALKDLLSGFEPRTSGFAEFRGAQFDHGLAWVHHPPGLGGLGAPAAEQVAVDRLLAEAGARPYPTTYMMGVELAAPTLAAFGSAEQAKRWLRRIFTCEDHWCQLFSEPGAGSDLASLATRADRRGDRWIVNGQKVWTTMAQISRWGMLLARTDPEVPKHRGITFLVVDMHGPGVDVRPLRQLTGDAEYNEVFLTDVEVPDSNRIGGVGEGWNVAMTTLTSERAAGEEMIGGGDGGPIARALELWHGLDPARHIPGLRDELLRSWVRAQVIRMTQERARAESGHRAGVTASILKVAVSLSQQEIYDLCTRLRGNDALLIDGYQMIERTELVQTTNQGDLTRALLASLASSIGGGTTEIQKNLIAERILGLPGEPRSERDTPWSATLR
jgi:alkylation response protein AidB-like acyl-CoA dehydrogenase